MCTAAAAVCRPSGPDKPCPPPLAGEHSCFLTSASQSCLASITLQGGVLKKVGDALASVGIKAPWKVRHHLCLLVKTVRSMSATFTLLYWSNPCGRSASSLTLCFCSCMASVRCSGDGGPCTECQKTAPSASVCRRARRPPVLPARHACSGAVKLLSCCPCIAVHGSGFQPRVHEPPATGDRVSCSQPCVSCPRSTDACSSSIWVAPRPSGALAAACWA